MYCCFYLCHFTFSLAMFTNHNRDFPEVNSLSTAAFSCKMVHWLSCWHDVFNLNSDSHWQDHNQHFEQYLTPDRHITLMHLCWLNVRQIHFLPFLHTYRLKRMITILHVVTAGQLAVILCDPLVYWRPVSLLLFTFYVSENVTGVSLKASLEAPHTNMPSRV